jgi:hypothetical protein
MGSRTTRLVPRVLCVLLALAAAGLLALGCGGGDGDETFEGDGYSFTYPGEWEELEGQAYVATGDEVSSATLGPEEGANVLTFTVYRLNLAVTEANLDQVADEITDVLGGLLEEAQGSVTEGPTRVSVAGLPAFRVEGSAVNPEGVRTQGELTLIFDGTTEYFLNCQFTPDRAQEMQEGCDQVLDSFAVE